MEITLNAISHPISRKFVVANNYFFQFLERTTHKKSKMNGLKCLKVVYTKAKGNRKKEFQ